MWYVGYGSVHGHMAWSQISPDTDLKSAAAQGSSTFIKLAAKCKACVSRCENKCDRVKPCSRHWSHTSCAAWLPSFADTPHSHRAAAPCTPALHALRKLVRTKPQSSAWRVGTGCSSKTWCCCFFLPYTGFAGSVNPGFLNWGGVKRSQGGHEYDSAMLLKSSGK